MNGNDFGGNSSTSRNNNLNQGGVAEPLNQAAEPAVSSLRQRPMIRPQPEADGAEIVFRDKPPKSPTLVGVICGIAGLIVGGAGIFGLMQLIKHPEPECAECDCPPAVSDVSNDLNVSFLTLEPQGQNLIYSPLSIRYGLSLLDAGASGNTKTEIDKVLGDTELPKYQNIADELSLANAVFVRDSFKEDVLQTYTDKVVTDYNAEVIYDDFASSANMDNWVGQKTFGLINSIGVQPTEDTEMVLVNALAIQMNWVHKFDSDGTSGQTFYKNDGSEITATTMHGKATTDDVSYYTDDNITALTMPLEQTDEAKLEFVAVMPQGDLTEYTSTLDFNTIETALENATPASTPTDGVEIYIPKFKFEYELDFMKDLQTLGIKQAFTDQADFSNMASKPLFVSDAIHKANIDFSEEGIKAAAVTAFVTKANAAAIEEIPQPVVISIDHPFLFLIRDKNTGAVWFTGTVYEPNLWENDASSYGR